jgi:acetyl esterase/lipase
VPFAYLGLATVGALAVLLTFRPLRQEPLSVPSFVLGFLIGEVPIQTIVWQVAATVVFAVFGAFEDWAGWLGLALSVISWVGLVGLAVSGRHAGQVVERALAQVRHGDFPVPSGGVAAGWDRSWKVSRAIPLKGRAVGVIKNIDYWGDGDRRHRLDIYHSRRTAAKDAPVMVYIHGGAWVMGEKREQGKPMMYELVTRGWVCVAINYRLSPRATWPAHIVDAKRAVAWVKAHIEEYGGDPSFVAVSGGSAGGHLCALLALTAGDPEFQPGFEEEDTSVDACVPFYGVMDMTGTDDGASHYGSGLLDLLEKRVMKTSATEHPEIFRAASPTYRVHAERHAGPSLGRQDLRVRPWCGFSGPGGVRRTPPGAARVRRPRLAAVAGHLGRGGGLFGGRPVEGQPGDVPGHLGAHSGGYSQPPVGQRPVTGRSGRTAGRSAARPGCNSF